MRFRSLLGQSPAVSFREALFQGIAPDGSLYVPESFPVLTFQSPKALSTVGLPAVAARVLGQFIDEIPPPDLLNLATQAFNFPIPLVKLEEKLHLLELFHGPTLAFKDVGARFMASALSYFLERERRELTIAVATSGDTGSAVAHGFFNVPHISVFVLYPSGRISRLQEQQMTTLGGNIHALEVEGTFDDCQRLLKQALADDDLVKELNLTTANSINLGRLIPQITYHVWGVLLLGEKGDVPVTPRGGSSPIVAVPSGNFGNLTAAAYAKQMGADIVGLVSASNANDVVPEFFRSGIFRPRPSVQTYSNAMDVGNPSNFARLQALYGNDLQRMRRDISAFSITDQETLDEIRRTYERSGIVLDPHTAVGVAAVRKSTSLTDRSQPTIVVATAHPAKFPEVIAAALDTSPALPHQLQEALARPKQSVMTPANYKHIRQLLLS